MERILKAFKDLFICENCIKKHFSFAFMLLCFAIPMICSHIAKDTMLSNDYVNIFSSLAFIFFILAIVPVFLLEGFSFEFVEMRLRGESGIPKLNLNQIIKGFKGLPIYIVWFLYFVLLALIPRGELIVPVLCLIGIPFIFYILIKFIKNNYEYKFEYFNPVTLFDYMKKTFKDTIILLLKMLIVFLVLGVIYFIIFTLFIPVNLLIEFVIRKVSILFGVTNFGYVESMFASIPFAFIVITIFLYMREIFNLILYDHCIDIYKNKIESSEDTIVNE